MAKIQIYDCGCVATRPKDPSCATYGTRFRVYHTVNYVMLKCRDCGRIHHFALSKPNVQLIRYTGRETEEDDKNGMD